MNASVLAKWHPGEVQRTGTKQHPAARQRSDGDLLALRISEARSHGHRFGPIFIKECGVRRNWSQLHSEDHDLWMGRRFGRGSRESRLILPEYVRHRVSQAKGARTASAGRILQPPFLIVLSCNIPVCCNHHFLRHLQFSLRFLLRLYRSSTRHSRQCAPVIPVLEDLPVWLDPGMKDPAGVSALLRPYDARLMRCYPVSGRVNSCH